MSNEFKFSTKQADSRGQLIDFGFRWYDPEVGRWTQRDPIGVAGGLNLYTYCNANPPNLVDPWGLQPLRFTPSALPGGGGGPRREETKEPEADPFWCRDPASINDDLFTVVFVSESTVTGDAQEWTTNSGRWPEADLVYDDVGSNQEFRDLMRDASDRGGEIDVVITSGHNNQTGGTYWGKSGESFSPDKLDSQTISAIRETTSDSAYIVFKSCNTANTGTKRFEKQVMANKLDRTVWGYSDVLYSGAREPNSGEWWEFVPWPR